MRNLFLMLFVLCCKQLSAQDSAIIIDDKKFTLKEVVVRNHFDYKTLLATIQDDTSFYKAFRNLRILGYSSYNDIKLLNKKGNTQASLFSKTKQIRNGDCRTMEVLEEVTAGDFYKKNKDYNYLTPELYASLFFTKGKICGENNIVKGKPLGVGNKKGIDKYKEQLKMLFFNPGKKISGIPFIGDKLDLYDEAAHKLYDYKLDVQELHGELCYVFSITPKEEKAKSDRIIVDQMITWFNMKTLEVIFRNYSLSYRAGVYDFDVSMEVEMTKHNGLTVPKVLRYRGNWDLLFKKRERAIFTATLFDFNH